MTAEGRVLSCDNGCNLPDDERLYELGGMKYHSIITREAYLGPDPTPSEAEPCGPVWQVSSGEVNEWGCPSCGGLFVVTDEQAATHYRLCVPEGDDDA